MSDRSEGGRKRWILAGGGLLLLAAAGMWSYGQIFPRSPDDPQELLHRASASDGSAAPKPVGKPVDVVGKSESGATVHAQLQKVAAKGEPDGFVVRLGDGLKEGDSATLKLPGGGELVMTRPKDGAAPPPPPPTREAPR